MYGGAKWLMIGYEDQLRIKEEQVKEAFYPILKWLSFCHSEQSEEPLSKSSMEYEDIFSSKVQEKGISPPGTAFGSRTGRQKMEPPIFHTIIPSPEIYGYRNKVEFSWGKYISAREGVHDEFRFGFHAQGQFDRIENCTYCALADEETNEIFQMVDTLSRASGLSTYDPKT
jgi:tRNA/tmRNA/rRNA uracil-C5-methylase (TrmA/RlmC/RlmD family)